MVWKIYKKITNSCIFKNDFELSSEIIVIIEKEVCINYLRSQLAFKNDTIQSENVQNGIWVERIAEFERNSVQTSLKLQRKSFQV